MKLRTPARSGLRLAELKARRPTEPLMNVKIPAQLHDAHIRSDHREPHHGGFYDHVAPQACFHQDDIGFTVA